MISKLKSTLLIALSLIFTSTLSLTFDIPPQAIASALSRNPNLRGPPIPYGFSTRIVQNSSRPLNANDLYICAIETMYHWAGVNIYEEETPTAEGHSAIIHGLQISYQNIPEGPIKIHWKHVILSILTALDSMDKTNTFAETIVEMKQDEKIFGTMRVGNPQTDRVIEASGETNAATAKRDHSKSVAIHRNRAATDPNTHTSKTIIDPDTPEIGAMNITYQRFGNAVDCKLLFSTALDGIAYAAADDNGDTWPYSTCYNWSKKMMYQTVQVKIGDGGSRWTADLIKRVARLLPQRLFEEGQCGEVRFRVEIEGTGRVGTGSFQVLDFVRQGPKGLGR